MNSQEFVQALNKYFLPEQLVLVQRILEAPPKSASDRQIALSKWFQSLAHEDKERILSLLHETLASCIFSFLVLLDNCDSISSEDETGYFELFYATSGERVRLNIISEGPSEPETYREANEALVASGQAELLHDLFIEAQGSRSGK